MAGTGVSTIHLKVPSNRPEESSFNIPAFDCAPFPVCSRAMEEPTVLDEGEPPVTESRLVLYCRGNLFYISLAAGSFLFLVVLLVVASVSNQWTPWAAAPVSVLFLVVCASLFYLRRAWLETRRASAQLLF